MKLLLYVVVLLTTAANGWAQIPNTIGATSAELAAMAGRILVVQLDPIDPETSAAILTKKRDVAEAFKANYEASQQSYLDNIQAAMEQGWTFNERVEFRTTEECKELFLSKSPDHVVMKKEMYGMQGNSSSTVLGWRHYAVPYGVTALTFFRTDMVEVTNKGALRFLEPDFQMYMMGDYGPEGKALYSVNDLVMTMKQTQKALAWCIGIEKPKDYFAYAKEQAEQNCKLLQGKELVAESNYTYKDTQQPELLETYGPRLRFASHEELGTIYRSGSDSEVVFFSVPIGHVVGMGGESHIAYMKIAVDPSTDNIIHGSFPMAGGGVLRAYRTVDFKALKKCK